jgi:hypothetical protein
VTALAHARVEAALAPYFFGPAGLSGKEAR